MKKYLKFIVVIFALIGASYSYSYAEEVLEEDDIGIFEEEKVLQEAEIVVLNKITSKPENKIIKADEELVVGNLSIILNRCISNPSGSGSEDALFLTISQDGEPLFHGWLFSHNLSINSFEHSVFEIIPLKCRKEVVKREVN